MRTIVVEEYRASWKADFERLRALLSKALGDAALSIEHVGSTSVEGLAAKPILDIDVVTPEGGLEAAKARLERAGFRHKGDLGIPGRESFQYFGEEPLPGHHLYVCPEGGAELRRHLALRNWLRAHPDDRARYAEVKREGARRFPRDIDAYIEWKGPFIREIYRKCALSEPNRMWSSCVQTPEELNRSRALRFREDNASLWLDALGAKDGMDILELGCGGGLFCDRLAGLCPNARVTGLDRDEGCVAYARAHCRGEFLVGDALATPFPEGRFDLCYSYTVMEHVEPRAFLAEQRRVLKRGGRAVVMSVWKTLSSAPKGTGAGDEERALMARAWAGQEGWDRAHGVCTHPFEMCELPPLLEAEGFTDVRAGVFPAMKYAPDDPATPPERAREQIEVDRLLEHNAVEKPRAQGKGDLTDAERARLHALIDARFDARQEKLRRGEKQWEYELSVSFYASGTKA